MMRAFLLLCSSALLACALCVDTSSEAIRRYSLIQAGHSRSRSQSATGSEAALGTAAEASRSQSLSAAQSYLASLSTSNLTASTVCNLRTLPDELSSYSCAHMPHTVMLHIPKTAGTALEYAGMMQGVRWGCHMSFEGCAKAKSRCFAWHTPPSWMDKGTRNLYEGRDVFCVIRNPYERALSEYRYFNANCDKQAMNDKLAEWLETYQDGKSDLNGCHLVPQSEYVWGPDGHQWCQSMLRFEEFPHSFDQFMASRNMSVRLKGHPINVGHCQELSPDDFSQKVVTLINQVYHEDFERLNYPKRSPMDQDLQGTLDALESVDDSE